jgi:hypothetical protein
MHKLVARGWDTDGYWRLPVYFDLDRNFHEVDVDHPTKVWNLKSWLKPANPHTKSLRVRANVVAAGSTILSNALW